ncbi:hypothetical protein ACIA5C_43145 [Actinoplanes sp. NPDC051343]|uniref:hypothetical protein n=1 Tax=Actinoplanes sp. NPDC051343 TaxID=3363906 RepID=UPI0037AFC590
MIELWPQLPQPVALSMYADLLEGAEPTPATSHAAQLWAPIGSRVSSRQIRSLLDAATDVAQSFGYPQPAGPDKRVAFDRAVAPLIRDRMALSWSDAGNRGSWSFLSLVVLPHLTNWRFGLDNRERWVATDLTRHAWARLWWQAVVFEGQEKLLDALTESDLNQLLERRSIGGDPRLVAALAKAVVEAAPDAGRRAIIRDASRRLRRYLAFVDVRALATYQVEELCRGICAQTLQYVRPGDQ